MLGEVFKGHPPRCLDRDLNYGVGGRSTEALGEAAGNVEVWRQEEAGEWEPE